jgi:hypothetical protein
VVNGILPYGNKFAFGEVLNAGGQFFDAVMYRGFVRDVVGDFVVGHGGSSFQTEILNAM